MFESLTFDLKVARKRAGLTQFDCGHLLGISHNIISRIELGKRLPTIKELMTLSLIYGQSFEDFYRKLVQRVRNDLTARLANLPDAPADWPLKRTRLHTIKQLWKCLQETCGDADVCR